MERTRRVNLTVTVPELVKARVRAFADAENNRASRIVENAVLAYLGTWGTEQDQGEGADERRARVASFLGES